MSHSLCISEVKACAPNSAEGKEAVERRTFTKVFGFLKVHAAVERESDWRLL